MSKSKKVLIGSGIAAGVVSAAAAVSHGVTKKLASIAMDRPVPEVSEKAAETVTGTSEQSEFSRLRKEAANRLLEKEHETVELEARDGETLVGHWFFREGNQRTIVAMHGWRSSWVDDFGMISGFWLNNGCNVLFAEQRGQNNSGGDYIGFGLLERYDCADWAVWVQERCDLPIYLSGVSMGASTVLMAAGKPLPPQVVGVLADCGFSSAKEIIQIVIGHMGLPPKLAYPFVKLGARLYGHFDLEETSAVEAMATCTVPVIFFHGEDDAYVPCEMSRVNYEACAARKRLVTVPGAGHGLSYPVWPERYLQEVREFFGPELAAP